MYAHPHRNRSAHRPGRAQGPPLPRQRTGTAYQWEHLAEDWDHLAVEVVFDREHEAADTGGFELPDLLGGGAGCANDPGVGVAHVGAGACEQEIAASADLLVGVGDADAGE